MTKIGAKIAVLGSVAYPELRLFRSPLEYIDAGERSKRSIKGIHGFIISAGILQELNQFNVTITFRKIDGQCFLDYRKERAGIVLGS